MTHNLPFPIAISNWRRFHGGTEDDEPKAQTCGSAERLYAAHPERQRGAPDEVRVPISRAQAERLDGMLPRLTADQRQAWLIRGGFRQPTPEQTPAWIDRNYVAARIQLCLWWGLDK